MCAAVGSSLWGCVTAHQPPAPAATTELNYVTPVEPALDPVASLAQAESVQEDPIAPAGRASTVTLVAAAVDPIQENRKQDNQAQANPEFPAAHIATLEGTYPIDLPTALRLAAADNLLVAQSREQIRQAQAEHRQAGALWLPSLRAGVHWNKHEGPLLSSGAEVRDLSRNSLYAGAGAMAVGAGSPAVPGVAANFHFADAIFQPLAAQQRWGARESAATATRNNVLLEVALAYTELLRVHQDQTILLDIRDQLQELSHLTDAYAQTGQGLQSDAERMRVELGLREIELRRSTEAVLLASARLAQALRLDPCVRLDPLDQELVELKLFKPDCECCELVAMALQQRPETRQSKYLVGEAVERLRRERYAPLVPSVLLGASYGGFGGGLGSQVDGFGGRLDLDATAFWEIRNLGVGESSARDHASSRLRQAQLQELMVLDQIARETTEAYAQVQLRQQQIAGSRELVRLATDSYQHHRLRIQHAQGLPIETLQSLQALVQSRREYVRAITEYNSAQFTLQRALGWPLY